MLEGLVANLLNRFLGMYVQNFDAKQLNVGIWSGDVKLRNLELRREALDQLNRGQSSDKRQKHSHSLRRLRRRTWTPICPGSDAGGVQCRKHR